MVPASAREPEITVCQRVVSTGEAVARGGGLSICSLVKNPAGAGKYRPTGQGINMKFLC